MSLGIDPSSVSIPMCRVCFHSFDDQNKAVYLLPCVHKVYQPCAHKVHQKCRPEIFKCPECFEKIKKAEKIDLGFTSLCVVVKEVLEGSRPVMTMNEVQNCAICIGPYTDADRSTIWERCGHRVHPSCGEKAAKRAKKCHECRANFSPSNDGTGIALIDEAFSRLNGGLLKIVEKGGGVEIIRRSSFDHRVEILGLSKPDIAEVKAFLEKKPIQKAPPKSKTCWDRFVAFFVSIWDALTSCCHKNKSKLQKEKYPGKDSRLKDPSSKDWDAAKEIIIKYIKTYTKKENLEKRAEEVLVGLFTALAFDEEIPVSLEPRSAD